MNIRSWIVASTLLVFSWCPTFAQIDCDSLVAQAQGDQKLLYAVDILAGDTQSQYLVPTIENLLLKLEIPHQVGTPRFDRVDNVSRLREDKEIYRYLGKVLNLYNLRETDLYASEGRNAFDSTIVRRMKDYNDFLYLKINPMATGHIEYQFYRYHIDPNTETSLVGTRQDEYQEDVDLPLHEYVSSASIFINLAESAEQHIQTLTKAIKQVFCETNIKPEGRIISNHLPINDTAYFSLGDTAILRAEVLDVDSRAELFTYSWRGLGDVQGLNLTYDAPIQRLPLTQKGCYTVGLRVNDGIVQGDQEDRLTICVRTRPQLYATPSYYSYGNWESWVRYKRTLIFDPYARGPHGRRLPGRFIGNNVRKAFGRIICVQPDSTWIYVSHDESNPADFPAELTLISVKVSKGQDERDVSYYESQKDDLYAMAIFNKIYPTSDNKVAAPPNTADTFGISFLARPSLQHFPPQGTYRFQLTLQESGLQSEPVMLTTHVKKASPVALGYTIGYPIQLGEIQQDSFNSFYGSINLDLEVFPYLYLLGGVQLRARDFNTDRYSGSFYWGVDYALINHFHNMFLEDVYTNLNPLAPLGDVEFDLGLSFFGTFYNTFARENAQIQSNGFSTGIFGKMVAMKGTYTFRLGLNQLLTDGVTPNMFIELSRSHYFYRNKFKKKYRRKK